MGRIIVQSPNYSPGINKQQSPSISENAISHTKNFNDIFEQKQKELRFSVHAQKRISSRNIEIDPQELRRVEVGIEKLKQKGARESVVLVNEKAYLVSVNKNTVVTVIDDKSLNENVFTNIDSMIVLK